MPFFISASDSLLTDAVSAFQPHPVTCQKAGTQAASVPALFPPSFKQANTPVNVHLLRLLIYKRRPSASVYFLYINDTKDSTGRREINELPSCGHHSSCGLTSTCHGSELSVINILLNKGEGTSGYPVHSHKHTRILGGNSILSLFYRPNAVLWMADT